MVTVSILCTTAAVFVAIVLALADQLATQDADYPSYQVIGCDKEFVSSQAKNGEFGSPVFSNRLLSDVTCRYSFHGEAHERVQIIFKDIQLNTVKNLTFTPGVHSSNMTHRSIVNCEDEDSVTVTVFLNGQSNDIGVYCEDKRPPMLMSIDNRLEVTFIKRSHSHGKGFQAQYKFLDDFGITTGERSKEKACEVKFWSEKNPNGTFWSPNFPGLYPRKAECHYLFFGRENERIYITFPYFDVEGLAPKCDDESESDYVEFSNFNVNLTDRKMNRLCGTKAYNAKNDVNSDGNFFRVTFKSNHIYDATGFEAFYQFRRIDDPYATPKRPSRASDSSRTTTMMDACLLGAVTLNVMMTQLMTTPT